MNNDEITKEKLNQLDQKIDAMYVSVEKTRKYLLMIMWSSIAMIVLPLLAGALILPWLMSTLGGVYGGIL